MSERIYELYDSEYQLSESQRPVAARVRFGLTSLEEQSLAYALFEEYGIEGHVAVIEDGVCVDRIYPKPE